MKNLKSSFSVVRSLRPFWIAGLLAAVCSFGTAVADDTSLDDSAKKVGNNFGELLKGMGQEVKKAGGSLSKSDKKDKKNEPEPENKEQQKDKAKPN